MSHHTHTVYLIVRSGSGPWKSQAFHVTANDYGHAACVACGQAELLLLEVRGGEADCMIVPAKVSA